MPSASKPSFDPSQPYKAAEKPAFDPDKPFQVPAKAEGVDVVGLGSAVMRGGAHGIPFADEAYGVLGAFVNPMNSDKGFVDRYHQSRDYARTKDEEAAKKHPIAFGGAQALGTVATAFAPGMAALAPSRGAGLIEAVGKGAAGGALYGADQAKEFTDIPAEAARGAKAGAVIGGGLNIAGRAVGAVIDKLKPASVGSVLLNAPESALNRYIENPEAVNAARSRSDIVQNEFIPRLEKLQSEVSEGSKVSRAILAQEGHSIPTATLGDLLDAKKQEIIQRSEGILDDPSKIASIKWLEDTSAKYRAAESGQVSTNRVKDFIQTIDKMVDYEVAPGQFSKIDDLIKKDIRHQADQILKSNSAEYAQQMKHVAEDTTILKEVSDLAKSPQGFDNLLKRTQRGNAPHLLESIKRFDERTGGGLLKELEDSAAKEALDKGAMNGSRNVNLHGNLGESIGQGVGGIPGKIIGKTIGFLGGATVDKYGPQMARSIVDSSAKVQSLLSTSRGLQLLGKYSQPLVEAATKGNQALATTHAYLFATDPTYRSILTDQRKQDAIRRRTGGP